MYVHLHRCVQRYILYHALAQGGMHIIQLFTNIWMRGTEKPSPHEHILHDTLNTLRKNSKQCEYVHVLTSLRAHG